VWSHSLGDHWGHTDEGIFKGEGVLRLFSQRASFQLGGGGENSGESERRFMSVMRVFINALSGKKNRGGAMSARVHLDIAGWSYQRR